MGLAVALRWCEQLRVLTAPSAFVPCPCSYYVPAQSRPELGQYFFAYAVTISNEGQQVVMLESRHWIITDGKGKIDHVR